MTSLFGLTQLCSVALLLNTQPLLIRGESEHYLTMMEEYKEALSDIYKDVCGDDCPETPISADVCWTSSTENIGRIIGGTKSKLGEWPGLAQIMTEGKTHRCGATILTKEWVLTAAHCFDKLDSERFLTDKEFRSSLHVYAGKIKTESRLPTGHVQMSIIKKFHQHPLFDGDTYENDLALARLEKPLMESKHVQQVCLDDDLTHSEGEECTVMGYGTTSFNSKVAEELLQTNVKLLKLSGYGCGEYIPGEIKQSMFCAGYMEGDTARDSCQGDSGGPLMCKSKSNKFVQTGIVSFGEECAKVSHPGVYTNISQFAGWINRCINDINECITG